MALKPWTVSGGGEACWTGVRRILSLRDVARECGVPIFYTRNVQNATNAFDSFATKTKRDQTKYIDGAPEADLLECVKPLPTEMIIPKSYASAFYGTPLQSYLVKLGIDTVIIVGGSTSGCCRATAVDAVTRNYNLGYVEDCLFDRITISHKAALLDVWMKYGDVVNSDYVKEYFYSLKEEK
jgi:nicotinamidase-related amidase